MAQALRIAIYGCGQAGRQLARALSEGTDYRPVAFLDDHAWFLKQELDGLPVHSPHHLSVLIEAEGIRGVLLAMPSVSRVRRSEILRYLSEHPVFVRTLPDLSNYAECLVRPNDIREVQVEDLLEREIVAPKPELLRANIHQKTVLVTGAGGSIGSELSRQILRQEPKRLILLDHSEYNLYEIERSLEGMQGDPSSQIVARLVSIVEREPIEKLLSLHSVDTIYHAAAYKHVPLVEKNPLSAIRNNVFGTLNLATSAVQSGVETFILVSSDKAVRPRNVMGATKRLSELILQALSHEPSLCGETCFSMVRFGNVLDSSGSVVPLFREQIRRGGPITLTDERMVRYFMTIPEAAGLVIQAGALARGGEVFVLDMGEPVRIFELAKKMIRLNGLIPIDADNPDGDIEIRFVGRRKGEKLHEELLLQGKLEKSIHERIYKTQENFLDWEKLQFYLEKLSSQIQNQFPMSALQILGLCVEGYHPLQ